MPHELGHRHGNVNAVAASASVPNVSRRGRGWSSWSSSPAGRRMMAPTIVGDRVEWSSSVPRLEGLKPGGRVRAAASGPLGEPGGGQRPRAAPGARDHGSGTSRLCPRGAARLSAARQPHVRRRPGRRISGECACGRPGRGLWTHTSGPHSLSLRIRLVMDRGRAARRARCSKALSCQAPGRPDNRTQRHGASVRPGTGGSRSRHPRLRPSWWRPGCWSPLVLGGCGQDRRIT